ncbi:MAG TPA: Spy/CpxP family protein refolding chaperone [Phycisphaerae bacterium]|nr:Spy/CpxP family protein refolding chaperone [Phycisphaerae bacterium]
MVHRHVWLATVATLLLALAGFAQEGERKVVPDQAGRPDRGRMGPRRNVLVDRLTRELTLTPDQRDQVQQIVDRHQQQMRAAFSDGEQAAKLREHREKMRTLRRDLQDARREGDNQKVEGLQKQMDELAKQDPMLKERQAMLDQIEGVLDGEQKVKFREIRDDLLGPGRSVAPDLTNPAVLRQAVSSLKLEDAQRDQIRELFREHRGKLGELSGAAPDKHAELNKKLYEDVVAKLTPEQREQLEQWRPDDRRLMMLQNPRVLRRMLERMELRQEQKTEIDALFERSDQDNRNTERGDRQVRRQRGEKLLEDVMNVLDENQKKQLTEMGAGRGMGGWGRGMRGPRGPVAAPQPQTETEAEVEVETEPVENE